jgi:hypothetical protein
MRSPPSGGRKDCLCRASCLLSAKEATAAPLESALANASDLLTSIVDEKAYVGEVYSLGYEDALVQIHDFHRREVGGIPALSFLIATRVLPGHQADVREDSSLVLLRVLDKCDLPDAAEALRVRVETAKRVSGEVERFWDHKEVMDAQTAQLLGHAGVKCRVLGTFYVNDFGATGNPDYRLTFGSDLSNYYPNRGLKVFKPKAAVLAKIINYRDPLTRTQGPMPEMEIGHVRYASTNRPFQKIGDVPVLIAPTDLLGMKTALFGMTRTGKSNTTKVILKSIFALRWHQDHTRRIGQVVFDPNGEYANDNTQDKGGGAKANAIYSTDALRIHERFSHDGTNGEAFGLVSEVWGKILLVHLLRCFERQGLLDKLDRLAFVLDGPLAVFGPPAWISASISAELKRINGVFRKKSGTDLLILGIEKTGAS